MTLKFFVSFTGLLRAMSQGKVSEADLATGIFYFGCLRVHAVDPSVGEANEVTWFFGRDPVRGHVAHQLLVEAIEAAERDGRVEWRASADARLSLVKAAELLERHGFRLREKPQGDYNYPAVAEMARDSELDLEVVY